MTARVAQLTPRGRGGVAVVGLAGEGAGAALARVFRPARGALLDRPIGSVALGAIEDARGPIDQGLVARAGAEAFELGLHGGEGVARAVVAALVAAGAVESEPEPLEAELVSGASDAASREARALLPLAPTESAARVLAAQANGLLARAVETILTSDDDVARAKVDALLATSRAARATFEPPSVFLLGAPNAGKSTLLNALLGRARAITSAEPGTTRDLIEEVVSLDRLPARIVDAAGVRDSSDDDVERAGIARARERAMTADLRAVVLDAASLDEAALALAAGAPGPKVIVINKRDLVEPAERARIARAIAGRTDAPQVLVSAEKREGLETLAAALRIALAGAPKLEKLERDAALVTPRQTRLARAARDAFGRGDRDAARAALREIVQGA